MLRIIALNAAGGAQVVVNATIGCRRVEIIEDESVQPQGLIFQSIEDNFVNTRQVSPATEPVILGNAVGQGGGISPLLGLGPQLSTQGPVASKLWQGTSATAATTKIAVTEIV